MLLLFISFFLISVASGMKDWERRIDEDLSRQVETCVVDWIKTHPDTSIEQLDISVFPERITGMLSALLIVSPDEDVIFSYEERPDRPPEERVHIIWRILNPRPNEITSFVPITVDGTPVAKFHIRPVEFHTFYYSNLIIEKTVNLFLPFSVIAVLLSLLTGFYLSRFTARAADRLARKLSKIAGGEQNIVLSEEPITELNSISQSVQKLHRQLVAATLSQKQWIDDISHDLKTPISAMQIQLEGIQDGVFKPDSERIQNLLSDLSQVKTLVDKFMLLTYFSRPDIRLEIEQIDFKEFLQTLLPFYRDLAGRRGIGFKAAVAEGSIASDRELLTRILSNLLINAVKYCAPGGTVTLSSSFTEDGLVIIIENSGSIPEKELPLIYNSLFRGEKSRTSEGSGLGLTIVKKLVELLNGKIEIENAGEDDGRIVRASLQFEYKHKD